jgi:hypothetical protein
VIFKIQKIVSDRTTGKVVNRETVHTGEESECIELCNKANNVIRMGICLVKFYVKPFNGKFPIKINFNSW